MATVLEQLDEATLKGYVTATTALRSAVQRLAREEEGQATAEYVAVIVLIAGVIGIVATNFGRTIATEIRDVIEDAFKKVGEAVNGE